MGNWGTHTNVEDHDTNDEEINGERSRALCRSLDMEADRAKCRQLTPL
jgi:hypothetical protein